MPRYFGSAASAPPSAPVVFTVNAAPEGAWPSIGGAPFYFSGHTYIGYCDSAALMRVAVFNHTTGAVTNVTVGGPTVSADQHNAPAVLHRSSDDRLVTAFCDHNSSSIYVRVSTNPLTTDPTISGGWQTAANIDGQLGGTAYTYPALFEFDGKLLIFYRDNDGDYNWCISTHALDSSDLSSGWAAETTIAFATRAYGLAFMTSPTRMEFFFSDGSYCSDKASVWHCWYNGTNFKNSAGTNLAGSAPFAFSAMTKVYDGATNGARVPASIVNDGSEIAVVFPVNTGTCGTYKGDDEDYLYCRATVGSATWSNKTIASAVGGLTLDFTEGSLVIDPADINHVILSKRATSSLSYPFHLYDYLTADGGTTWTITAVSVSGDPDMYPWYVIGYQPELEYVWLKGTFTTSQVFNTGIQGYGVPV